MKSLAILSPLILLGWLFFGKHSGMGLNKLQVIGSHNSYKEYIDTPLYRMIEKVDSNIAKQIEYGNCSLTDQLNLGLRSLEIDVFADAKGGKYAHPGGLAWAGKNPLRPYDPQGLMNEPGFKVLHFQDVDFRSNCLTLKNCLHELKTWSDEHPEHEPIFITMNTKDDTLIRPNFTLPEKFTAESFNELDKVIVGGLGADKIITPDLVRGKYKTLEKAVLKNNWPKLNDSKGKFIFALDEKGEKVEYYIKDHPSLKNRVLFVNAPAGTDEAAIMIINDPVKELNNIRELVKKGYIVRTRADSETKEARTNDRSRFVAACKSGAQIISTDYYAKSRLFKSDYIISFNDGKYIRKNPVLK